uniref:G-protein coupled receptors family 1 profile domain-containing protein n=1 Tax=Sinocyclocheilus anshuiensis TaxID=1608454 RepID=A0A671PP19_9TELE
FEFNKAIYYYIFLFFVYIITVLGNSFLMIVIIVDRNLHTPKYIAVFNLALTDICESTAVIPQQLEAYVFGNQFILYGLCITMLLALSTHVNFSSSGSSVSVLQ